MTKRSAPPSPLGYELPALDGVDPTREPWRHFVKGEGPGQLLEVEGRRPSPQLCVAGLRAAVGEWRESGYQGASETTQRLFRWWFDEVRLGGVGFRPYFSQREAIETLVFLLEMQGGPHLKELIERFHSIDPSNLIDTELEFAHSTNRELRVRIPGHGDGIPLAPEDVARYAIKAATGSGKTMMMSLFIAWSYFHSQREVDSRQASNFLVIAPNVIVFERLKSDFGNARVFRDLQLAPPGWSLDLHVLLRGDAVEPVGRGNLVVTNIQQLYEARERWVPRNAVERILGRPVVRNAAQGRPILARVQSLASLAVLNDEAHHVLDPESEWHKTVASLHAGCPGGLAAWLDFSATPRFMSGAFAPWIVSDYPLAQAVEDQVVKTPIFVDTGRPKAPVRKAQPRAGAKATAAQYSEWIELGVARLKALEKNYKGVAGAKPVMFVMCENVSHAEDVAKFLRDGRRSFGIKDDEILVIHTKGDGEIKESDLDELRRQSRLIDEDASKIRVVVSVLILREGWDVRNVSLVVGLRPANSKNEILPEQAVGRGLRLMRGVAGRQVLEVIGTESFAELVGKLEVEGVYVNHVVEPPKQVRIEPVMERMGFDISIPRTGSLFQRNVRKVSDLDPSSIPTNFTIEDMQVDLTRLRALMIDIATGTPLGHVDVPRGPAPLAGDVLAAITRQALEMARLPDGFADLYPIVQQYVVGHAFGQPINLGLENVRRLLARADYRDWLAASIADAVGQVVTERRDVRIEASPLLLSETEKFIWRRQTTKATKTIFNLVATFNNFESQFGEFLDSAKDVKAFSALAETFTRFSVDYLKPTGAMGRYYPDWVIHQRISKQDRFWIAETKGREFEGVEQKDAAIMHWCSEVSARGKTRWGYVRVNQDWWDRHDPQTFDEVVQGVLADQRKRSVSGLHFWPDPDQ